MVKILMINTVLCYCCCNCSVTEMSSYSTQSPKRRLRTCRRSKQSNGYVSMKHNAVRYRIHLEQTTTVTSTHVHENLPVIQSSHSRSAPTTLTYTWHTCTPMEPQEHFWSKLDHSRPIHTHTDISPLSNPITPPIDQCANCVRQALKQSNALIREFVALGKFPSAMRVLQALPSDIVAVVHAVSTHVDSDLMGPILITQPLTWHLHMSHWNHNNISDPMGPLLMSYDNYRDSYVHDLTPATALGYSSPAHRTYDPRTLLSVVVVEGWWAIASMEVGVTYYCDGSIYIIFMMCYRNGCDDSTECGRGESAWRWDWSWDDLTCLVVLNCNGSEMFMWFQRCACTQWITHLSVCLWPNRCLYLQ